MLLIVLAYLGGVLTILACILPVLPFVFARRPAAVRSGLPLLVGMALTLPSSRRSRPSAAAGSRRPAAGSRSCCSRSSA